MKLLSQIKKLLLYSTTIIDDDGKIRREILEENRRFAIVWSLVEIAYWIYSIVMSFRDAAYTRCRAVYIVGLVICLATLTGSMVFAKKKPRLIHPIMLIMHAALLGAGVGIALAQYDVRTIMLFATPLIVPVMFVDDDLWTVLIALVEIVIFAFLGARHIEPEVYRWSLGNLVIFSTMGIAIGHFVDKERFERNVFAQSAVKLAELQTRYAYYDQLTGLKNRRAYEEEVERLTKEMPEECCIVMVDINGLKEANDTRGHAVGDELIFGAAECLRQGFESVDSIYRIGGDEFCAIMECDEHEAARRLEKTDRICAGWRGKNIQGISISHGFASVKEYPDIDSAMKAADQRMYQHKQDYYASSGKDRRRR